MKKNLLLIVAVLSCSIGYSQSQRMVFMEEFTQASCPPCEATTPAINAMIEANESKIVQIRYQTSWPGVDPMNADNPTEVQTRVDYYSVGGVPSVHVDGIAQAGVGVLSQAAIDASYANSAPVLVVVEHTVASDLSSMDVTVRITNEGTEAYSVATNRLRVALVERVISWPTRPGSTSIVDFDAVLKSFFTGAAGMELPEIAAGDSWEMTWETLPLPSNVYNVGELAVVAFVQDDATKLTVNSAYSEPNEPLDYVDLSVVYAELSDDGGICSDFNASVEVENRGGAEAVDFTVDMIVNGSLAATETVATLAGVSSTQVDFGPQEVVGTSIITFQVNTDAQELGTLNNSSRAGAVSRVSAPMNSLFTDYENDIIGAFPSNVSVNVPAGIANLNGIVVDADGIGATTGPVGGFGQSDQSMIINFFQWNPATNDVNGEYVILDQFEVPSDGSLSFDYAFTTWGGSNDRVQIQVSTDCGETYTDVFNKAGSELATAPEINQDQGFFIPVADDWRAENVDLSAFSGEVVLVRLYVTSAWGDMFWIDNIQMNSPLDINDLNENESLLIYPNPASHNLNVELSIEETSNVTVRMVDMLGRTVLTQQIGTNLRGVINHTLNVSDLNTGSYVLFFQINEREVVQRVNISH